MKKAEERCSKIEEEKEDKKPSPGSRVGVNGCVWMRDMDGC